MDLLIGIIKNRTTLHKIRTLVSRHFLLTAYVTEQSYSDHILKDCNLHRLKSDSSAFSSSTDLKPLKVLRFRSTDLHQIQLGQKLWPFFRRTSGGGRKRAESQKSVAKSRRLRWGCSAHASPCDCPPVAFFASMFTGLASCLGTSIARVKGLTQPIAA